MDRARRVGSLAALAALLLSSMGFESRPPAEPIPEDANLAAAVGWPTSTLLVSEVVTGGASASDEFAELTNAGGVAVDLTGYELVYVTSTGSTITRKVAWTAATILGPGTHLLVANASGAYATGADATYSGGFAATGGALVLRPIGGEPVDAVGWGDAANAFVEGGPVAPPPAGSSIERIPGGSAGNGVDTNDNAVDFTVRALPSPQNLASEPTPGGSPSPTPNPTASPTPIPTPTPAATPGATPSATATPSPSPTSTPTPTLSPAPPPTPSPSPSPPPSPAPTPTPTPTSSPAPIPTPTPPPSASPVTPIADARTAADGTVVTVSGTLTTDLGALESGRIGFVQDATAGIAVRLDVALPQPVAAGTSVTLTGPLGSYFSLRVLSATAAGVAIDGTGTLPEALVSTTGGATESLEGRRLFVGGQVTEAPTALADGLGIMIDDGSGPLRVIASTQALGGATVASGDLLTAVGPLGQRDSSGTGAAGYRLHATGAGELSITPAPTPTPTPAATPTPTPSPTPTATPAPTTTPAPTSTPAPTPGPGPGSIAVARSQPIGSVVSVTGVVTAEAGRLGTPSLIAIQDATAGIAVRVPDGVAPPGRGTLVTVRGQLQDPYGQLEIRPATSGISTGGGAAMPEPVGDNGTLGESVEGRLVVVTGTVEARPTKSSSNDVTFFLRGPAGSIRIVADASSGLTVDSVVRDAGYRIVGVAGQRASRRDAPDGYRVWPRDARDLTKVSAPASSGTPAPADSSTSPSGSVATIADAIRKGDGAVTVEGLVTIGPDLLDATGRRIVIEDRTAGLEVLLPVDARAPSIGTRIRVVGTIGRAYDAPRLKAEDVTVTATGGRPLPLDLTAPPTAAHEWRLVRVSGTVADVQKLGDRWRAEIAVGRDRIAITGLGGAGIPVAAVVEGRRATITGIARRPYPGASDRRWSIVPRRPADLAIASASGAGLGTADGSAGDPSAGPGAKAGGTAPTTPDVDLAGLVDHVGRVVRVGGIVVELQPGGFDLDDGTAIGRIVLAGPAAEYLPLIEPGDALNAIGRVVEEGEGFSVLVEDAAGVVRVGDPAAGPLDTGDAANERLGAADGPGSPDRPSRLAGGLLGIEGVGLAGFLAMVLLSGASLVATLVHRRRARRLLAARVADRLAAVAGPPSG